LKTKTGHIKFLLLIAFVLGAVSCLAQYKVKGTVYDSSRIYRIQSVTVMSSGGNITATDSLGRYEISVAEKDSVWFSYLGKSTPKYPVLKMQDVRQFDISLKLKSVVMEEIKIKSRNYRMDSIQNRKDYAKAFDYKKVTLGSLSSMGPSGPGIDIDELIRMFQFRKNKSMLKFQQRLMEQEREKYVDHKFTRLLVKRLTGLDGEMLEQFMIRYRPSFEFITSVSEYEFQLYIKSSADLFRRTY
jgi:hypothetical protein